MLRDLRGLRVSKGFLLVDLPADKTTFAETEVNQVWAGSDFLQQVRMHPDTAKYNEALASADRKICDLLAREIDRSLAEAENKVWHAHPVWFLEGNPVVGYSKLKDSVRLLFWSGQSFKEDALGKEGSFKAAEVRYTAAAQINTKDLKRWLAKAREIQWDYKNIVRRKGKLERLK